MADFVFDFSDSILMIYGGGNMNTRIRLYFKQNEQENIIIVSRHEIKGFLPMRKQRRLCFRCSDSTIPLFLISESSNF